MPSSFRKFEIDVLRILIEQKLGSEVVDSLISSGRERSCEHTGYGYFLTIAHLDLPVAREVFSSPFVTGTDNASRLDVGFVIFIENRALVLECHGLGERVPRDIRDREVVISVSEERR